MYFFSFCLKLPLQQWSTQQGELFVCPQFIFSSIVFRTYTVIIIASYLVSYLHWLDQSKRSNSSQTCRLHIMWLPNKWTDTDINKNFLPLFTSLAQPSLIPSDPSSPVLWLSPSSDHSNVVNCMDFFIIA